MFVVDLVSVYNILQKPDLEIFFQSLKKNEVFKGKNYGCGGILEKYNCIKIMCSMKDSLVNVKNPQGTAI